MILNTKLRIPQPPQHLNIRLRILIHILRLLRESNMLPMQFIHFPRQRRIINEPLYSPNSHQHRRENHYLKQVRTRREICFYFINFYPRLYITTQTEKKKRKKKRGLTDNGRREGINLDMFLFESRR